jgi:cold shock CspA family protein
MRKQRVIAGLSGVVRLFNERRCFGFIRADDGQDVYVRSAALHGVVLRRGQRVSFDLVEDKHREGRTCAENVLVLDLAN